MILATASLALLGLEPGAPVQDDDSSVLLVRAGTIHTLGDAGVVEGGAMLVDGGKVVAIGTDLEPPAGVVEVDFGPDAVLVPGFVAADSRLAEGPPSDRTAEPGLDALDGFDFYGANASALAAGVTSAYLTPARGRLIAGQGAVVKLAGDDFDARVLRSPAAIHSAISSEARNTPGYWEPPVPATVDVGLGIAQPQLPRTTMGALVALGELLVGARSGLGADAYGPRAAEDLAELVEAGVPWRITAVERSEVAAALAFAKVRDIPLVIDGAHFATDFADDIAEAGVPVIYELPFSPNRSGVDRGKDADREWPSLDVPAALAEAGVRLALTPAGSSGLRQLRFAAVVARSAGLDDEAALAAITRVPAEIYGVADRVGSLAPGRDADFVVFSGSPLEAGASVVATYVDGEAAWKPEDEYAVDDEDDARSYDTDDEFRRPLGADVKRARAMPASVVIRADEVHVGDGEVLAPGEVLIVDGRIAEVGRRVGRPAGVEVVSGAAAMPGMIDALGQLGLEGSRRTPKTDFDLTRIVEPGDRTDRRVAQAGVTTVVLNPQGDSSSGVPLLAYRPAASEDDSLVVDPLAALRLVWTEDNRLESGDKVREVLEKALEYDAEWREYAEKLAEWEAEAAEADPPRPEFELPGDDDEEADDEEEDEDENGDDKKKKKSKELDPDPVTGIWITEVDEGEGGDLPTARLQVRLLEGGEVEGFLRSPVLSSRLLEVTGHLGEEGALTLEAWADQGQVRFEGALDELVLDAEEVRYEAKASYAGGELELELLRESREYPMAKRKPRYVAPPEDDEEDDDEEESTTKARKSKKEEPPKPPREDAKLEPFRRAMAGEAAILVEVSRADEILECVDAFDEAGIRPVLLQAGDAHRVADEIEGRVAGVLLNQSIVSSGSSTGTRVRNRYADLQAAGIPVAFRSDAEEGAVDLPLMAAYAVVEGMSPEGAMRALTSDAADMLAIGDEVGRLARGLSGDVLLLDGSPLEPAVRVLRVWVGGREVR